MMFVVMLYVSMLIRNNGPYHILQSHGYYQSIEKRKLVLGILCDCVDCSIAVKKTNENNNSKLNSDLVFCTHKHYRNYPLKFTTLRISMMLMYCYNTFMCSTFCER